MQTKETHLSAIQLSKLTQVSWDQKHKFVFSSWHHYHCCSNSL